MRLVLVTLAGTLLTIASGPAAAEEARPRKSATNAPAKVLRLDELEVQGRVQKPQAVFLLPRARVDHAGADRLEPLLPKVTTALENDLFEASPEAAR